MDLRGLLAGPEAAMSIGSGILAQPLSGLAGLLALPAGAERAANVVRNTQQALTYQPQTEQGQRVMGALGGLLAPVGEAYNTVKRATGDAGYAVAGPLGGMLGAVVPDAALMATGALGVRRTPQAFPLPNQAQAGAIVYHGSPHKFDKFDSSKIGTGEGAQAYGHGLYLADNPSVAQSYSAPIRESSAWVIDGNRFHGMTTRTDASVGNYAANALQRFNGDKSAAIDWLKGGSPSEVEAAKMLKKSKNIAPDNGSLYKVDLPDSAIEKMLDWDKPLSQQPAILEKVKQFMPELADPNMRGGDFYDALTRKFGTGVRETLDKRGQKTAASYMKDSLGIPGLRYLDGNSRDVGAGTQNYVVFPGNEGLLKILERQ